ncbi:MAG: ferritin-like domain-containing protein [Acidobacteria bacterium]|nr:ferritin-like domain-containing protein [Acidobacteriota bacterium]
MTVPDLVRQLERENEAFWNGLPPEDRSWYQEGMTLPQLMEVHKIRCNNEIGAAEAAYFLLKTVPDQDLKTQLASQVEDEVKHFRLLAQRVKDLGGDPVDYEPTPAWLAFFGDPARLFNYDPLEVAAGFQLTAEGLSNARHVSEAVSFAGVLGDGETERIYREVIRPDELTHVQFGRLVILRLATTPERLQTARDACAKARDYMVRVVKEFRQRVYP